MCLYFFEGKGYSEGFTKHMAEVKEWLLGKNGPASLELVGATDEICAAAILLFAIVLTITCINLLVSKKHVHYV